MILQRMAVLLRDYDNVFWADQVDKCIADLESSDFHGVRRLLGLYGGMGSLNNFTLYREDRLLKNDNDQFQILRNSAWTIGMRLEPDR